MRIIRRDRRKLVLRSTTKLLLALVGLFFVFGGLVACIYSLEHLLALRIVEGIKGIAIGGPISLIGAFLLFLGIIPSHIHWIFDRSQGIFIHEEKFFVWRKLRKYALQDIVAVRVAKTPAPPYYYGMSKKDTFRVELWLLNGQIIPSPDVSTGTASKQRTAQAIREFLWDAGYFVR